MFTLYLKTNKFWFNFKALIPAWQAVVKQGLYWSYQLRICINAELAESTLPVADAVAERIERLIVDGVLKAGQTLPSERRLTEKTWRIA